MKEVTKELIKIYKLEALHYDFMGYPFKSINNLNYHHLLIPKRKGGSETIENGAALNMYTSHPYLHIIECYDNDRFIYITDNIQAQKILLQLEKENLQKISSCLKGFEQEWSGKTTKKGKEIIKEEYTRRIKL